MVSGFFLSFMLLKEHIKKRSLAYLLWKIPSRFLRLWVASVVAVLINWYGLPLIGNGPLWPFVYNSPRRYFHHPVSHFFLLSNLIEDHNYNWLWLLEIDFQLFVCFVPLLILYIRARTCRSNLTYALFYSIQMLFLIGSVAVGLLINSEQFKSQA